jgi:choline dehydrogenase-like flavoprotein
VIQQFGRNDGGPSPEAGSWDLCIVGAGAAGLALAGQFLNTAWKVIVLESGLLEPDAIADDLNSLDCVGVRHDGSREGRVRSFGGTTRAWGGQLMPMRASELAERPWVRDSGWPLELDDLQPYYRRVEELLRTEGPPYDASVWPRLGIATPGFDTEDFCVRFSQWAALGRRNFALLWRRDLEKSKNVTVLLDATVVGLHCNDSGEHCESAEVRSRHGLRSSIRARHVVLAAGGIETARLLLASRGANGVGVANRSGLVGRYFQDHISYRAGLIEPASRRVVQDIFDPRYVGGTMFSVKLEPTEAAMRRHRWLNVMAHIAFLIPDALGWMELKRIVGSLQSGRLALPSFHETVAMACGGLELTRLVLARTLARRRRSPDAGEILLFIDTEQAPNADSRVVLDSSTDALGMPRARLDWRMTDVEYRTLTEFAAHVAAEFARMGWGTVRLAGPPDFEQRQSLGAARDIFHHMGTTRMSRTSESGVTRPDLRCHDVDNLFIAGPSVFPTSGIANPTFTVLALTLRLADHLKGLPPT